NAVRVHFVAATAGLELSSVAVEPASQPGNPAGEWPLALADAELTDAPRIVWGGILYDSATQAMILSDAHLRFTLFAAPWSLPLAQGTACFTAGLTVLE